MCGIAGYIGARELAPDVIQGCLGLMHRRGPDQADSYHTQMQEGKHVYLLFSRLAIMDLDPRSSQPFRVGNHTLVFNGEIYNYLEQRETLKATHRVSFATESDSEVLMHTLIHNGIDGLDQLEGMWGFAYYNGTEETLTLSRDRFGEKPLYYYVDAEGGLYFASEPKCIFRLLGHPLPINHQHLYRFLVNGYKSLYKVQEHFFVGLQQVKTAHTLTITSQGDISERPYWVPTFNIDDSMTYADAVEGARERLIETVRLRLRADVPLAFCMSGGIDSNTLISIANNVFNYQAHGFTIVNTDERYDEQEIVDQAVATQALKHTSVPIRHDGFLEKLSTLVQYHDAPVYTISYFAHWQLMEAVHAHGYKISLSGSAADELFTGYYDHHNLYLYQMQQEDSARYDEALAHWQREVQPIVRNPYLGNSRYFIEHPQARQHIYLENEVFADYLRQPFAEAFSEVGYTPVLLRNRMANELFAESIPVILHEDDLNAMYYSIENRSPFLDRRLFEFTASIPTRHLIQNGRAKSVLREAMRGIVPDFILDNPRKVGFNAPLFDYLNVADPQVKAYLLDQSVVYDYVQRGKIEQLLKEEQLLNSQSKFLFSFIGTKMFMEQFT